MAPGGGWPRWPPLLPGPDLAMGLPPRGGAPEDGSIFLRSSLKGSSFLDGLSVRNEGDRSARESSSVLLVGQSEVVRH